MIFAKRLIVLSFICSFCVCSSTSWAMIEPIDSIGFLEQEVRSLRKKGVEPSKICVVLDFHGVMVEEATHTPPLTLKGGIKEFLQYLEKENIPNLIATAWDDFDGVVHQGIIPLGLQGHFEVKSTDTQLKKFILGSEKKEFLGYKNGRVSAIKKADAEGRYFRQKAYAVQLVYPNNNFQYVTFVDDSRDNLMIFMKDSFRTKHTEHTDFRNTFLYHLTNPNPADASQILEIKETEVKDVPKKRRKILQKEEAEGKNIPE